MGDTPAVVGEGKTSVDQDLIEVVQAGFTAYNERDFEGLCDFFHPDARWVSSASALDAGREYRGHQGVRDLLADLAEGWETFELVPNELREVGDDQVLVVGEIHAKRREGGVPFNSTVAWVWEMRDGRAYRMRTYVDPQKGLEAVGARRTISQSDLKIVRSFFEAFNRREVDWFLELLHPDIEYRSAFALGGVFRGHKGVREYFAELEDSFDVIHAEAEQFLSVGNVVVGIGYFRVRGKGSGIEIPETRLSGWVWELEDRKVKRFRAFDNPAQALAEIGLPKA
jgi:ketosteroid isomerase-like protein